MIKLVMTLMFWTFKFWKSKITCYMKMTFRLPSINSPIEVYETCVLGKKHIDPFPTRKS